MTAPPDRLTRESRSWFARAFDGLTRDKLSIVLGVCLLWALMASSHDMLASWVRDEFLQWLFWDFGGQLFSIVVIAIVMGLPIVAAGNLGPQSGWRRYAALGLAIALTAPLAAASRFGYLALMSQPAALGTFFLRFCYRYAELALLLTAVSEFHRHAIRSVEAMHRAEVDRLALDREMAEARLQVLQAQIEPHFLFNTLANVRRLYQTDLAGGRAMLDNLMRYLEVALPRMRVNRSTLEREITLAEAYLNVQSIRMGRRLKFEIDVAPDLHSLEVPPMMLLTLVENAIKHGLNPLPEGGIVKLNAWREGDRLRITVADNGRGFQATSGGGTGLANIRARLSAMHGEVASLTLVENLPRGVTSTLVLPAVELGEVAA